MNSLQPSVLEMLVDSMPSGLILLGAEKNTILRFNSRAYQILGLDHELHLRSLHDHLPIYLSPLIKLLKTEEKDIQRGELTLHLPARDEESTLGFNLKHITDESGSTLVLFIFSDISKVIKDQLMVEKIKDELHQSKKLASLGTLVAGVAHELNNPLTGISMSLSLITMQLGRLTQKIQPLPAESMLAEVTKNVEALLSELGKIKTANSKASTLVGDLLSYAKPNQLCLQPIPVQTFLSEVIQALHGHPSFSHMEINIEGHTDTSIRCDRVKLEQVLYNILKNSSDATHGNGKVRIFYSQEMDEMQHNFISIHIQDNGPGIDRTLLNRIFDPFFTTKGHEGVGLGLSISYRTVEQHGGVLSVESPPGVGAEHRIRLPIYVESSTEAIRYE